MPVYLTNTDLVTWTMSQRSFKILSLYVHMCMHVCQRVYVEIRAPVFWESVIFCFEALNIPGLGGRTPKGSPFGASGTCPSQQKKSSNYLG